MQQPSILQKAASNIAILVSQDKKQTKRFLGVRISQSDLTKFTAACYPQKPAEIVRMLIESFCALRSDTLDTNLHHDLIQPTQEKLICQIGANISAELAASFKQHCEPLETSLVLRNLITCFIASRETHHQHPVSLESNDHIPPFATHP